MAQTYKSMITIEHDEGSGDINRLLLAQASDRVGQGLKLITAIRKITSGFTKAKITVGTVAVQASGTVTLESFVADDTVTINGVVLTGKASPSGEAQFACGVSDTADAAALAAKINAHSTLSLIVSATSALGVVTLTALKPGLLGNCITTAISAHGSVAAARLAGGTDGTTERSFYFGNAT